jgi:putative hydrolase of the HAD superfamily
MPNPMSKLERPDIRYFTNLHLGYGNRAEYRTLTLLIDADDTLWENNVYFMEVTERFCQVVAAWGIEENRARTCLSDTERANIVKHGYGAAAFSRSVVQAFRFLIPEGGDDDLEDLRSRAASICRREQVELLPGVLETLATLSGYHELVLVTKGDRDEQRRKLRRSRLARFFRHVEIVKEKNVAIYRRLATGLGLDPDRTWMIGNSPRSDINPALAAGLGAVLVPHPCTWELEIEELNLASARFARVSSFSDLTSLFSPDAAPS